MQETGADQDFHGDTAPMSAGRSTGGHRVRGLFRGCPARAWTMLDHLIPFTSGYMMVAWGRKQA
jgi:hypothetical protein